MKNRMFKMFGVCCLTSLTACSQNTKPIQPETIAVAVAAQKSEIEKSEPHNYGGWYCPDNVKGFPAVDIANWKTVPVVNGRMPTKEETQNGTSLIFVDAKEYPNAKPLAITMPKLARFYCEYTDREELVIVIQAINVNNDSIVGFRYLNGGNGSAQFNEVRFLSDAEIEKITPSQFVSLNITIDASREVIWNVLTKPVYTSQLEQTFDNQNQLKKNWRESSNVNFYYPSAGTLTAARGGELYGNMYIQNDYDHLLYTEKFMVYVNQETKITELLVVCGPYATDFENQKSILINWAAQVKTLSENKFPNELLHSIPKGK